MFIALVTMTFALVLCWATPLLSHVTSDSDTKCVTHECREDAAAETLAQYTKWLAWFTAALAVASIAQGYFLIRAERLTRRSINLARDEFLATHRLKLKLRAISAPMDQSDETIVFKVAIANVGESAATTTDYKISALILDDEAGFDVPLRPNTDPKRLRLKTGERHIFERRSIDPWDKGEWRMLRIEEHKFVVLGSFSYGWRPGEANGLQPRLRRDQRRIPAIGPIFRR